MAAVSALNSTSQIDKLTSDIFSILENNFLFGYQNPSPEQTKFVTGKVRILSIDGGGATDGILAAKSILHLETTLRRKSGDAKAHISEFFDVVAGSGIGGVLAALLFTKGKNDRPLFTSGEALRFVMENGAKLSRCGKQGVFRRMFCSPAKVFDWTFGELTLKDTLKTVLIPCYDLTMGAPFVFSRADAVEMDGCDFKLSDVCAATTGAGGPTKTWSVDRKTKIAAVGGEVAMNNPTAAAITHVLHNKQEFPFCNRVDNLLVVSLGNGEPSSFTAGSRTPTRTALLKIVGEAVSDTVDQAVSMAFRQSRKRGYVRVQGNKGLLSRKDEKKYLNVSLQADEMLKQHNVESVLFQGKMCSSTNLEKLEFFAGEIFKENERRKTDTLPIVLLNQTTTSSSARTSSATTVSTISSS